MHIGTAKLFSALVPLVLLGAGNAWSQLVNLSDVNIGDQSDNNVQTVQTGSTSPSGETIDKVDSDASAERVRLMSSMLSTTSTKSTSPSVSALSVDTPESAEIAAPSLTPAEIAAIFNTPLQLMLGNIITSIREGPAYKDEKPQFFARYDFVSNNSFIGKGVLNTQQADVGFDLHSSFGLEIQPFFSYGYATDRTSTSNASSDTCGGTLSLSQQVFPFPNRLKDHPNPTEPLFGHDKDGDISNLYPRYDFKAGVDLTFGDAEKYTYKSGSGTPLSQDGYLVNPNLAFDLYLNSEWEISILPTWTYNISSTDTGLSGSSALFGVQDRNSYTVFTRAGESLLLYEVNILERDTNIESLPPASYQGYQTWAKFGVGVNYLFDNDFTLKATYTYEAFNKLYEAHYVTASLSYKF